MISVCLATYNGAKFLKAQLESILEQIGPNDEIIISDDGSTDDTLQVVKSFEDKRIKVYKHKSVGRPTENFQNALKKANGDIIFLADQDDIWLENKCSHMTNLLQEHTLVLSNSVLVDEELNVLQPSFFDYHRSKKGIVRNVLKNSYFGSCMAFKRKLLDYALPFPSSNEIGHDVWLGLVAEITGDVRFTKEPLILYRRHHDAVTSHGIGKSNRSLFIKLWGRVIMFRYVIVFYIKYFLKWKKD